VPYAAELVTRMYAGRADRENRIKALKEDLSLAMFCLQSFAAGCGLPHRLRPLQPLDGVPRDRAPVRLV